MNQDVAEPQPDTAQEEGPGPRRGLGGRLDALAGGINSLVGHLPSPLRRIIPRATRWRLIGLAVVVLLFVVWSSVAATATISYRATVLVPETVEGAHVVGIPPPGELDFGDLSAGFQMERELVLQNDSRLHTYITIITWGEMRDFISVDDAFFNLEPGEERTVTFTARVPVNAEAKRYSGRVYVVRLPWWRP